MIDDGLLMMDEKSLVIKLIGHWSLGFGNSSSSLIHHQ
jgi:hypothetical protein